MSKLDELIKEYCPNGVEYKEFGSICETITDYTAAGSFADIAKNVKYINEKDYALLVRTMDLKARFLNNDKFVYVNEHAFNYLWRVQIKPDSIVLPNIGNCGEAYYISTDTLPYDKCVLGPNAIYVHSEKENNKYIYYVFLSRDFQINLKKIISSTGQTKFNKTEFKKLNIPVPPLPVQEEIVRILDNFTELTAELTARKKQYDHYKDQLLPFDKKDVRWFSLGDISNISRGASPRPIGSFVTKDVDGINWIKIGDVSPEAKYITSCAEKITKEGAKKSREVHQGDFILSNSMSFGRPYILKIDGCIHDGWLSISSFESYVTSDYLYYVLTSSFIQKVMKKKASFGGAVQNLNADIVRGIEIPIPSKDEQNRIVSILDRFDSLCNDISSGLPAEIEYRNKQYEYYRDKLLTFKPLN